MFSMLSAGIKNKYTRIFYVIENNYWNLMIFSAIMFESHKYLFPVTRYIWGNFLTSCKDWLASQEG
jgi:hypothetical protein